MSTLYYLHVGGKIRDPFTDKQRPVYHIGGEATRPLDKQVEERGIRVSEVPDDLRDRYDRTFREFLAIQKELEDFYAAGVPADEWRPG